MKQQLYGLSFDYEGGYATSLAAQVDASSEQRVIPYQLKMIMANRIPRLLPVTSEEIDGNLVLRYEIATQRRFIQQLHVQRPSVQLALESACELVRTIRECTDYLLNENQFALHEDLVFSSGSLRDFRLCYLPIAGLAKKPVTEELRCLLLRVFSAIEGEYGGKIGPILSVLSEESYSLKNLEEQLKRAWLAGDDSVQSDDAADEQSAPVGKSAERAFSAMFKLDKLKRWMANAGAKRKAGGAKRKAAGKAPKMPTDIQPLKPRPIGRTELLDARAGLADSTVLLSISCNGKTTTHPMTADRWIIGRSENGIQYTDLSEGVSRIHCEIGKGESGLEAKDLGSLNGSYLNGERMIPYKAYPFGSADVLKYAQSELRVASGN